MSWTKQDNGYMRRSDGARVINSGTAKKPFAVQNLGGYELNQRSRGGPFEQVRTFASQEAAMRAADEAWPLPASVDEADEAPETPRP